MPLSFGQQRLWFLDQLEPESSVYNIPDAIRVNGELDLDSLEKCFNEVIRRQEVLRTTIATVEGKAVLVIAPELHYQIPVIDLSELPDQEQRDETRRLVVEESGRPFNIGEIPLFRLATLKLAEDRWVILFTLHHIISDGWSTGVIVNEIARLYIIQ